MLNAFKLKEFDLTPVLEGWKDGPMFLGDSKKDMPVEEWLEKIKEGCVQRGVPEEYWYKVGQHFMGPKALGRLAELKQVITKVHGGKYRWTWRKFKVAMMNMGWTIDKDKKETIKVQGKGSGLWFMKKKDTMIETPDKSDVASVKSNKSDGAESGSGKKTLSRSNSTWFAKKTLVEEPEEEEPVVVSKKDVPRTTGRPTVARSTTVAFWPARANKDEKEEKELPPRPGHQKARSDTTIATVSKKGKAVDRSGSADQLQEHSSTEVVKEAQAPAWLLNACTALEYITSEHPKAMSIISAILITAGSIPSIPAIAAGAGGAVLASSAAHAIGAIAVGVGQALSAGVAHNQKKEGSSSEQH
ncbi:hypothetical protein CVT24_003748 [Panaeolus cyanescens]|uniref:Uncharacterized protein n=1 Tax=Panaeolus cyanescens TaxID=181874 RepID=A0A409WN86_9AGAR|nr:hypothetical protein CVT24_003748 [Panaeolus cyanescens]